jgi:hypothetical protein
MASPEEPKISLVNGQSDLVTSAPPPLPGNQPVGFFGEVWAGFRGFFIEIIIHVLKWVALIASLLIIDKLVKISDLPDERKTVFHTLDFYGGVVAVVIFVVIFLIKSVLHVKWWKASQKK